MNNITATIASNSRIAKNTYEMRLLLPQSFALVPGQFINIRVSGFYLRRPISISDWNDSELTIVYKTVGRGTDAMSRMSAGDVMDILIPLGNGFTLPSGSAADEKIFSRPVLIGGGAGVPPMLGLGKALMNAGVSPKAIIGFNTADEVFYEDEFRNAGIEVITATADGSRGVRGFVTDVLTDLEYTSFFACGPEAMLMAVDSCAPESVPGWFSFEERMGCGFGACMGCSCMTKYGSKRICKDGPVLERSEIIW